MLQERKTKDEALGDWVLELDDILSPTRPAAYLTYFWIGRGPHDRGIKVRAIRLEDGTVRDNGDRDEPLRRAEGVCRANIPCGDGIIELLDGRGCLLYGFVSGRPTRAQINASLRPWLRKIATTQKKEEELSNGNK